jgi:hypothetical protein
MKNVTLVLTFPVLNRESEQIIAIQSCAIVREAVSRRGRTNRAFDYRPHCFIGLFWVLQNLMGCITVGPGEWNGAIFLVQNRGRGMEWETAITEIFMCCTSQYPGSDKSPRKLPLRDYVVCRQPLLNNQ